ncbi:MAG: SurA N-terminal domain-containing protein [Gammaproteobacteria bacterium]|nr:SurA N-terminal domain-containing protein [Gammaproteobacteria bacterium]
MNIMKKLIACLFLVVSPCLHAEERIQPLDTIVATVNDSVITQNDLNNAINTAEDSMHSAGETIPDSATLKKQVLNQLIDKQLQLQIAHDAGVKITPAEVNEAIKRIADQNHASVDALYQAMAAHGMSKTDYRKEIQTEMLLQKVQQQEVAPKVSITPEEVDALIKHSSTEHPPTFNYQLEDFYVPLSDNPSTSDIATAKNQAEKAAQSLREGKNPSVQKNDLGWLSSNDLPSAFAKTVPHMQKNAVANPIQTGNGFHVLRLTDKKLLKENGLSKPDAQRQVFEQKFEKTLKQWLSLLRSRATIRIHDGA